MEKKTTAIVLAAGQGKRMNTHIRKTYLTLAGKPILYYCLQAFEESFIDEVILVVGKDEELYCRKEIVDTYGFTKVVNIVEGGKERYHSVHHGLCAITDTDYVFIHDGARPFVNNEILKRALEAVQTYEACVIAMPVKDTIKITDEHQFVKETPSRDFVWMMQTPQVFVFSIIKKAYQILIDTEEAYLQNGGKPITDDAMVAETFVNQKIKLVYGSYQNIKITTPEDIKIAETFLL